MQPALGCAGFGRRAQFRPGQIGFQEFIGDQQSAAGVAIRQVMAAGEPKIRHWCAPGVSEAGSRPTMLGSFIDAAPPSSDRAMMALARPPGTFGSQSVCRAAEY